MVNGNKNRRDILRGMFALGATAALPKIARAQQSDASVPKNPFILEGQPHDYMAHNPWPDPKMRELYRQGLVSDIKPLHSQDPSSLNHIFYFNSDIDFSGKNYSGVPEINTIDDYVIAGDWANAYKSSEVYIRSGALNNIKDDALKIRVLSSLAVALRWDGDERDYDPRHPRGKFPFPDDIARELQAHIYNLSNSKRILDQIIPPELKDAFLKMTEPGSKFDQAYKRLKEINDSGYRISEEFAAEKYKITRTLHEEITSTMDRVYGSKPTPIILDSLPPEAQQVIVGQFYPVDMDPDTESDFDRLAAKTLGENFIFVSYSNPDFEDTLLTAAHEKLHAVQNDMVRDLEQGNIPDDDPRFPMAQLYALNEVLYSVPDIIACNKNLAARCDQTNFEYLVQPWEANAYSFESILGDVLNQRYNAAPETGPFAIEPRKKAPVARPPTPSPHR